MALRTDTLDLGALRLTAGEGRQLSLAVVIEPLELGGHIYSVTRIADAPPEPGATADQLDATLDISRMTGAGYALRVRFAAALQGPCMRCLEPAAPEFSVDAREVSAPGEDDDEELDSPYVIESILDLSAWAHDALSLALPATLLCQPGCLGLCPVCGENLNTAGPEHVHPAEPDPRWAALSELTFDGSDPARERPAETEPAVSED